MLSVTRGQPTSTYNFDYSCGAIFRDGNPRGEIHSGVVVGGGWR